MNVLSLFAGAGGLELGLERAGMTVVGQVERDPYCQRVLAQHWPEVPKHDDVLTAPEWWGSSVRPAVDLVCGGFPCQPFSLGGYQRGVADERWLWPAFERVIRAVRPRYVLVENVSALHRDALAFGWVLGDLHALGFDAEWTLLRASDVGAPHARERLFLVAYDQGEHGFARRLLGEGRDGRSPLAARGLPSLDVAAQRQAANEWLAREPGVDRLVDGIPAQVDRLRLAGNAVVPQVAEHVGRIVMAAQQGNRGGGMTVRPSVQPEFTVEQLDWIINRAVHDRDFEAIRCALTLMAVQDPNRADDWRQTLLLAVAVAQNDPDITGGSPPETIKPADGNDHSVPAGD